MSDGGKNPVVASVAMGYGHLRAAVPLARQLGEELVEVDRPPVARPAEARLWRRTRVRYERLSRWAQLPGLGGVFRRLLAWMTRIEPLTGPGGLHAPDPACRILRRQIANGLGKGLARYLATADRTLLTTFYLPALAVEHHGRTPVACVLTDSDVHRVWAPPDPGSSRILYLAAGERGAQRMRAYGVPARNVRVTGFPLPQRLCEQDPGPRLERLEGAGSGPPLLVLAIGGAGAQADRARLLIEALAAPLAAGDVRLAVVAGARPALGRRFRRWRQSHGFTAAEVEVLAAPDFGAYLAAFESLLERADVLWTKPSEMVFYAGLGLPLILDEPVGDHERTNAEWIVAEGAGLRRPSPDRTGVDLMRWLGDGRLAGCARRGWARLPRDGTRRILAAVAELT